MELFPQMKNPQINKANYTTLLKDIDASKLLSIKNLFLTFNNNNDLYDMFINTYRYYEINDEDEEVFVQCVNDVFNTHLDYYKELYNNYTKQYDFATDNKRITTRNDNSSSYKNDNNTINTSNDESHYDLPNKVVSSPDGYKDSVIKDTGSTNTSSESNSGNDYESEIITKYDNEFLSLKRQYLAQIRNVNYEFCTKFIDCFLKVYS